MRKPGAILALTVLVAVGFTLGACGGDDSDDETSDDAGGTTTEVGAEDRPTTSGSESTTTTAPPAPEERAISVYRKGQDAFTRALAAKPPNPDNPQLARYFSGDALTYVVENLLSANQNNEYWDSDWVYNPEVAGVTEDRVTLIDCASESYRRLDVATDELKDSGRQTYNFRVEVTRQQGGWRTTEIVIEDQPCNL